MRVSALNRKLLRDLIAMKGQALAIAMVVAAGVSMYVMYLSNFTSLQRTRATYYDRQRFAHVFAPLKRAPLRVANEIADLPGVSAMETRVVANVTLDLEQLDEPASGRLISIPSDRRPRVNGAAFDMEGGFNDVVLTLSPGIAPDEIISRLDRILEPYGGLGAIPRALQLSHWTIENELAQLQSFGFLLPLVFLLVAAFILNVALTRALALQRTQIAALKALGYANLAIGWHYLKWALAIGAFGVVIGIAGGAWLGHMIIQLYNQFFRFPVLLFSVPMQVVVGATVLTLVAAGGGAFSAVRRAVRVPPAEAMRPEAPARYRRTVFETPLIARHLGGAGRMVLRNVTRHPLRAAASIFGIGFAVAILMIGFVFADAIERLIETQFWVAERQDVTVAFVEPRSEAAHYALSRLPGVIAVEPQRMVAARVRSGYRERYLSITSVPATPRFKQIVDRDGRAIQMPASGMVLSQTLAKVLDVKPGDSVTVEILEGLRPVRQILVSGQVDDILGLSMYMEQGELHRLMREGEVASGALLLVDAAHEAALSKALKALPVVAGAGFKRAVLQSFRETMAANMNLSIVINLLFAGVIAFGVVYNAARVSLSERSRELASLRVLGFTRAEISLILLGELTLLTLVALPVGALLGYGLAAAIVQSLQSEVYRFPLYVSRQAVAWAFLGIVGATLVSALLVRRRLDNLDLVAVLKSGSDGRTVPTHPRYATAEEPTADSRRPRRSGNPRGCPLAFGYRSRCRAGDTGPDAGDHRRGRRNARPRTIRRVRTGHRAGAAHRARAGRSCSTWENRRRPTDACCGAVD
jgi:putative ABC transport system permease protein